MYGNPQSSRAWQRAHRYSSIYGRRSDSVHARARTMARPVLAILAACLILITIVTAYCAADRLGTPAAAVEVSRG
jgi:hypothetical protein